MEVLLEARPQRERLLDAMTEVVADKGYAAATVADAVRAARVSRGTFYELFASKEDCFLEGYRPRGRRARRAHPRRRARGRG